MAKQMLLTKELEKKLVANHVANAKGNADHVPVVKFFGGGACTWLISEYDPDERTFFGLCDLGMGEPELGYVSRDELESIRFQFGLRVERDYWWTGDKPMSEYARVAHSERRIVS